MTTELDTSAVPNPSGSLFKYPIEDCDVRDRGLFADFRQQLDQWNVLFNLDGAAAIVNQMGDLLWQDACWRTANEARRFTEKEGPNASVAPLISRMIDRGYITGQVISIAKLLEASPANQPKKAVVSLRRIADEVRACRHLITRENFVCQDVLPYDYEPIREREYAKLAAQASADGVHFTSLAMSGPDGWDMAAQQHEMFDCLSGVSADARAREDLIEEAFFDRIDAFLNDPLLEEIRTMRHKSVAHAADAGSREAAANLRSGVTLKDFDRAHYLLSGVYQALSVLLFGQWRGGGVPVPLHDIFEYCDKPFISTDHLGEMESFWRKHSDDRERFLHDAYRELIPERIKV